MGTRVCNKDKTLPSRCDCNLKLVLISSIKKKVIFDTFFFLPYQQLKNISNKDVLEVLRLHGTVDQVMGWQTAGNYHWKTLDLDTFHHLFKFQKVWLCIRKRKYFTSLLYIHHKISKKGLSSSQNFYSWAMLHKV